MNLWDILSVALICLAVLLALRGLRRRGGRACSCGGNCCRCGSPCGREPSDQCENQKGRDSHESQEFSP